MVNSLVTWFNRNESAVIYIYNPPVNALNTKVFEHLLKVIDEVENDKESKVVIFTGFDDQTFSVGADIREFSHWAERGKSFVETKSLALQQIFSRIANMRKPTIAAIHGLTLGGGCELVLSCDLRIIEEQAEIGLPEIKLGLFPGAGGTQRLPRLVGEAKAKEIMFTGDPICGKEAAEIGLVNKVVHKGEALEAAEDLASKISNYPLTALYLIKKSVNEGMSTSLREGLQLEAQNFGEVFETEDVREGVDAFLNKRKVNFKDNNF